MPEQNPTFTTGLVEGALTSQLKSDKLASRSMISSYRKMAKNTLLGLGLYRGL